jgi:hypothetical protein
MLQTKLPPHTIICLISILSLCFLVFSLYCSTFPPIHVFSTLRSAIVYVLSFSFLFLIPQFVWGSISGVRGSGGSYPRFSVPFTEGGGHLRAIYCAGVLCTALRPNSKSLTGV